MKIFLPATKLLICIFISVQMFAQLGPLQLVMDLEDQISGLSPTNFVAYNNLGYFAGFSAENWGDLWVTDGTIEGTNVFLDFFEDNAAGIPKSFTLHNDLLYFLVVNPDGNTEMWRTDGTQEGSISLLEVESAEFMMSYQDGLLIFVKPDQESFREELYYYSDDGSFFRNNDRKWWFYILYITGIW